MLSACTNNAVLMAVNVHCQPIRSVILVNYVIFHNIFYQDCGAAVYVSSSTSVVSLQRSSFFNCTAGPEPTTMRGGCAYLENVLAGSGVANCCATRCAAHHGSFWSFGLNLDAVVTGLAVFDCKSAGGALSHNFACVHVSGCNFTSQTGAWGTLIPRAAAIVQSGAQSSTKTEFTLFRSCRGGFATFYIGWGMAATFNHSTFDGCDAVIAHGCWAVRQDVIQRCYLVNTSLKGSYFEAGTVLIWNCLFAGAVPEMPAGFLATGDQQANAVTRFVFPAGLLKGTCPRQAPVELGRMPSVSQLATSVAAFGVIGSIGWILSFWARQVALRGEAYEPVLEGEPANVAEDDPVDPGPVLLL
jgi:hypothetical protein